MRVPTVRWIVPIGLGIVSLVLLLRTGAPSAHFFALALAGCGAWVGMLAGRVGAARALASESGSEAGQAALPEFARAPGALVFSTDRFGRIAYADDGFRRRVSPGGESPLGRPLASLLSPHTDKAVAASLGEAMDQGKIWLGEFRLQGAEAGSGSLRAALLPLKGGGGAIEGCVGILADAGGESSGGREQQEDSRLRAERDAALAASEAKSAMLADVSHEIRTPINVVIGMLELSLETDDAEEQRRYMRLAQSSAESMLSIVNDILDFSKIEAGKLDLESIPFSIRGMLSETLKCLAPRAHGKGIELVLDVAPELPESLIGDPGRLRQVIVNLAGNAIKFTERGEVCVRVLCEQPHQGRVLVHMAVSDTGIGIPADRREAIFESFTQASSSTAREHGGTGLGLTISSRLVGLMGGRIAVASEPGQGSVFSFSVEFGLDAGERAQPAPPSALEGRKVLVADDNEASRGMLAGLLRQWKMQVSEAKSGTDALVQLNMQPADLVLLDSPMPDMDGFGAAEKMLRRPDAPRVALLSSIGAKGDAKRCRELGIGGYLPKPVGRDELFGMVRGMLAPQPAGRPELVTRHSLREEHVPMDVLLVEDNELIKLMVRRVLERHGHRVEVVSDGNEALAKLRSCRFDAALVDLQIPALSGLEVVRRWRAEETDGRLPIVALSAGATPQERAACTEAGMDDFIAKPVDRDTLLSVLDRIGPRVTASGRRVVSV